MARDYRGSRAGWKGALTAVLAASLAVVCGCKREEAKSGGGSVQANDVRIATLSPAVADTIRALGRGETIVARHGYDSFTDPSIPTCGSESGIDYEALLRVNPTHVILQGGAKKPPPRLEELASEHGWKVLSVPLTSLKDVQDSVPAIAQASGEQHIHRARDIQHAMERAWSPRDNVQSRVGRVLILAGVDPPGVMGPGSFHSELLERLGAVPLPQSSGSPYISMSVEDVVKLDPDSIILLRPGGMPVTDPAGLTESLGPLGKVGLRCIRDGRVLVITDPKCQMPSTALIGLADEIEAGVKSWLPIEAH